MICWRKNLKSKKLLSWDEVSPSCRSGDSPRVPHWRLPRASIVKETANAERKCVGPGGAGAPGTKAKIVDDVYAVWVRVGQCLTVVDDPRSKFRSSVEESCQ